MTFLAILLKNWQAVLGALGMTAMSAALGWMTIDRNQWRAAGRKADAVLAQIPAAQAEALAAAKRAIAIKEQQYKDQANVSDTTHGAAAIVAHDATGVYADAHRVPVCPAGGATGGPAASPQSSNPGVPASVPASPLVAVSDADLQACAGAVAYAMSAHDWAVGL